MTSGKTAIVVLLAFVIAITPSLSDAEQLRHSWEEDGQQGTHPWMWIAAWYSILLIVLVTLWRHL